MPAVSESQRKLMALAEHHPSQVYSKNKSVTKMSHSQLHDFASTKGLHGSHSEHPVKHAKRLNKIGDH